MDFRIEQAIEPERLSDIEPDGQLASEALRNYLMRKYGSELSDFTVLSDEPELTFLSWDDDKPIAHEKLRYSGCRIAEIEVESKKAHVLYAVSGDAPEYRYGGMDDFESEAFGVEVANKVAALFGERLTDAKTVAGRVAATEHGAYILLSGRFSDDWLDVISSFGILNIDLTFESKPASLEEIRDSLASMFDGFCDFNVIVVVRATFANIDSDISFIWSNGK